MSAVIAVFDASGHLGGSVCRALAQVHTVKAILRKSDTPTSQGLVSAGVQLCTVDYDQPATITEALKGTHGCFVVTNSNYQNPDGYEREIREGKLIAHACAEAGVQHVVYSTQLSVVDILGIRVRHMDAKAKVEAHMKQLGLPLTSVIVPCFYESLLMPPLRPKRTETQGYFLEIPMGNTPLNMISVDDVGDVVLEVFTRGQQYLHKTLSVSGDTLTVREIAALLSRELAPRFFRDKQITSPQLRSQNIPGSDDLANMFDFFCRVDQRCSIDLTKALYPRLRTFHQWLAQNRNPVAMAMDYPDKGVDNSVISGL